jgi:hypothetical protein
MYEHKHLKSAADAACAALLQEQGHQILRRRSNSLALLKRGLAGSPALQEAWERATAEDL